MTDTTDIVQSPTIGRPTKYRPDMPEKMLEYFGEGLTVTEVCAKLRITKQTFYRWEKENEEFSYASRLGRTLAEAEWIKKGRESLLNRDINVGIWNSLARNCFGWDKEDKEKSTNTTNNTVIILEGIPAKKSNLKIVDVTSE